ELISIGQTNQSHRGHNDHEILRNQPVTVRAHWHEHAIPQHGIAREHACELRLFVRVEQNTK
ncbi:hypothetical protein, partial [Escherichia coli]|uniref:hypothetical protein n=1 Tax=Escherichia coli TaxID=562 RepID=UPI002854BC68